MSTSAIRAISLTTDNYEIESEVLVKAARSGFRIGSVPIESIYVGEKSQIHPIVDTIRFIRFIFKAGFKR